MFGGGDDVHGPRDRRGAGRRGIQRPLKTLQSPYAWRPLVILGGWAVSYERGTPVQYVRRLHPKVGWFRVSGVHLVARFRRWRR